MRNWLRARSVPVLGGTPPVGGHTCSGLIGCVAATGVAIGLTGSAAAEPVANLPARAAPAKLTTIDGLPARRVAIDTPREMSTTQAAQVARTIYLERCRMGCLVHKGLNDARTSTSSIPIQAEAIVTEFASATGLTGAGADAEWAQVVRCMKEVYSPYDVVVTDVKPLSGQSYHEAIIAGRPGDIGFGPDILGVAPLASDCSAIDNAISFAFANNHPSSDRVLNICWTAAQESAHAFGLDHEFSFITGNIANDHSACNDPMTYRTDCGGEKFFRNEVARCGEDADRACKCGALQNSHRKLLEVFGAGTSIIGNPTIALVSPTSGGTLGDAVIVQAGGKRGVAHVDLYFNGYRWTVQPGAAFESHGQPDPSSYTISVDADLPDSIVDVQAIAYDDLGNATESVVATVTKGAPCATADTCAPHQKCEAGRCFWDPPTGDLGDGCSYDQSCKSGQCTGTGDSQVCTQDCIPDVPDGCPDGFACVQSGPDLGTCLLVAPAAGCCSAGGGDGTWWARIALGAAAFGLATRRRRR